MLLTLPDDSIVDFDPATLSFKQHVPDRAPGRRSGSRFRSRRCPFGIDAKVLVEFMTSPAWRFGDCFRRISDHPRYSPKGSVHDFRVTSLTKIYQFSGSYQGGTFSSSNTEWCFLDGGIVSHAGYGFGSSSWTVIQGAEALRAVCLFFGIVQPERIKGESVRRPLAALLEEMTEVPLQSDSGMVWGLPKLLCGDGSNE